MGEIFEERRRFTRYPIYCPTQYKCEDSTPRDSAITMNMSEGGGLIAIRRDISVDSGLIFRFYFKQQEFLIRSRVVHVQHGLENGLYNIGVEFLEKSPDFTLNFYDEIEAVMLLQRKIKEARGQDVTMAEASMKWYSDAPGWQ